MKSGAAGLEDLEIQLLLEGVRQVYGYDFRDYASNSIRRRLRHWLAESEFDTFSQAQSMVLRERGVFESLLRGITVNVTEMFRDPAFFKALRTQVVPYLKTYPFVRIWHAGCASGEEAYSMAILLNEEGMAGRYLLYATDINESVLGQAREGAIPIGKMQQFTRNYYESGGRTDFADYYSVTRDRAVIADAIKKNILFAPHNLAADGEFGEMQLILCRNVMMYFKSPLKERSMILFEKSLSPRGFLCTGISEKLENLRTGDRFEVVDGRLSIYRKI